MQIYTTANTYYITLAVFTLIFTLKLNIYLVPKNGKYSLFYGDAHQLTITLILTQTLVWQYTASDASNLSQCTTAVAATLSEDWRHHRVSVRVMVRVRVRAKDRS